MSRPDLTEDFLRKEYWEKEKTISEIAREAGYCYASVQEKMVRLGIPRRSVGEAYKLAYQKGRVGVDVDLSPSNSLAYILGVAKGDGSVDNVKIELMQSRKPFAESFEKALEKVGFNANTIILTPQEKEYLGYHWQAKIYDTYGCSKRFAKWYNELTLEEIGNLLRKKESFVQEFLRGFYESEGSISTSKHEDSIESVLLEISNSSEKLLCFVSNLLEEIGLSSSIYQSREDMYKLRLTRMREVQIFFETTNPVIKKKSISTPVRTLYTSEVE